MKKFCSTYSTFNLFSFCWITFFLCSSICVYGQTLNGGNTITPQCFFQNKEIEFESIAAISNVLKFYNPTEGILRVKVKISCPSAWRTVSDVNRQYTVNARDTVYIPIRLVGNSVKFRGGVKYNFSAIVTVLETGRLYFSSFIAGKVKVTNIKMEVVPGSRMYLLNGQSSVPFNIELINAGNDQQDLLLTISKRGSEIMLTDSSGKFLQKNYQQVFMKPQTELLFPYGLTLLKQMRNQKRMDTYGFVFQDAEVSRHYRIYAKAEEPKPVTANASQPNSSSGQIGKTIDVFKLSSKKRVAENDGDGLPLTLIANAAQLFNQQPMINLAMNGRKILNENTFLTYMFQNSYSYYSRGNMNFNSAFGQVGYFHKKGSIQVGSATQIFLPLIRGSGNEGPGVAATYQLRPDHRIGFSYSNKRGELGEVSRANYNLGYSGKVRGIVTSLGVGLLNSNKTYRAQIFSSGISLPLSKKQFIVLRMNWENYLFNSRSRTGYLAGLNYNVAYLKDRANTSLQFTYRKVPNFISGNDTINNKPYFSANIFNTFRVRPNLTLRSIHVFYNNPVFSFTGSNYIDNKLFSNLFVFNIKRGRLRNPLVPALYINYSDYNNLQLLSQGLQLNVNRSNLESNLRIGFTVKAGLNKLLSNPLLGNFFTSQVNSFITFKTWIFNSRYYYGPQSQYELQSALTRQMKYSQMLFLSAGNQYQFKNKQFVMENTLSYTYVYVNLRHTTSLFSQFFFYGRNGWRFNLNFSVNYNSAENIRFIYDPAAKSKYLAENGTTRQHSTDFQFGIGAKKDLNIPLPNKYHKKRFATTQFIAFLDVNGNRRFDANEVKLENVILRLNEYEAQTDMNGEAIFENVPLNKYKIQIQALDKIGPWFPLMGDSIFIDGSGVVNIPFSRGAQILGNVEVNRDKYSAGILENLDISRIKIIVVDSAGRTQTNLTDKQGGFSFYLPYGSYTLRLDESVLGSQFELAQNDVLVQLQVGMETFYQTFLISERKRKVKTKKFSTNGSLIEETGELKAGENK